MRGAGIVFISRIGSQVFGFLTILVLARFLGAELFGSYQLGLATIFLLSNFTKLGMDRGLVRYAPIFQQEENGKLYKLIRDVLGNGFFIAVILSFFLYINSNIIGEFVFHSENVGYVLRLFSFYLPIFTLFMLFAAVLDSLKKGGFEAVVLNIVSPGIYLMLLLCCLFFGLTQLLALSSLMIANLVAIIIFVVFLYRHFSSLVTAKPAKYDTREFYRFSMPLSLIGTLYLLMNQLDVFFIGYFTNTANVGMYSVAYKFAALMLIGLQAVVTIFSPHISELYHNKKISELANLLKLVTKWIALLALFLFFFFTTFRFSLLSLFGKDFSQAATVLIILAFGQLVNALAGPTGAILIMSGKQMWEVYNSIFMVIFNIILNIVLIPRYGIAGAAIATSSSIIFINVLKVVETFYELRIHPYSMSMIKGLAVTSLGCACGWLVHLFDIQHSIWTALVGGFVMSIASALLLFWVSDENDKQLLQKFIAFKSNVNRA